MYIHVVNGEAHPYSVTQLRRDNPGTSFPQQPSESLLAQWNVYPVTPVPRPEADHTQNVAEGAPNFDGTHWVQTWVVTDATDDEIARRTKEQADAVRAERDIQLAQCDWTQLADCPLSNIQQTAWATYRQALRDVPEQAGFPFHVVWPTA